MISAETTSPDRPPTFHAASFQTPASQKHSMYAILSDCGKREDYFGQESVCACVCACMYLCVSPDAVIIATLLP